MNDTEIRWTTLTWNPMSGCASVSPGCKHCYARQLAEQKRGTLAFPNGFDLTTREHKLAEPWKVKTPSLIFVNSMSDLFWDKVTDAYRDKVVNVIESCPQHQFQVLTKRHENLVRYSQRRKLPTNFWAGVTVEDQTRAGLRIPYLLKVDVPVRFLSVEPALSLVDVRPWILDLQWAIWGGESGTHLMDPMVRDVRGCSTRDDRGKWAPRVDRMGWPRALRDACVGAGVPFFFKQWGGVRPTSAGHELDGKRWEQFPSVKVKAVTGHRLQQTALAL
jgi:protein gp37